MAQNAQDTDSGSDDLATKLRASATSTISRTRAPAQGLGPSIARIFGGPGSWRNTIGGVIVLFVVARIVLDYLSPQDTNLAAVVFIYSIVATGIALLYHYGGLLSIAHGGLWGIGAYFAAVLGQREGWPFIPVLIAAAIGCALGATLLASISIRVAGSYFLIILFAVSEVIYGVMNNWTSLTAGAEGIVVSVKPSLFGFKLNSNPHWYEVSLISLIVVLIVVQGVKKSRIGQRLKAIRDNRDLAVSVGVGVVNTHMIAFAITGAVAAVGGVYWGYFEGYVVPSQYSPTASIDFVLVVLLGGAAYLLGPTVGAIVVIFLPSVLHLAPLLGDAVIGAIFIAVILLSPSGLAGIFERSFHWALRGLSGTRSGGSDEEALQAELAADAVSRGLQDT